jgi:hypothetical protein
MKISFARDAPSASINGYPIVKVRKHFIAGLVCPAKVSNIFDVVRIALKVDVTCTKVLYMTCTKVLYKVLYITISLPKEWQEVEQCT